MKGGNVGRFLGGQFSFFLSALLFTTIFLWSWEKNPLLTNLLSPQDQFIMQPSGLYLIENFGRAFKITNSTRKNRLEEVSDSFVKNVTVSPSTRRKDKKIMTSQLERKACNFARGRWIAERRRPLYSGFKCKQWLSDMWACRLTQRTNFSYEGCRWQPENCEMPDFNGSELLRRMQDKTIAFIGDSLGRQQFQSLMCMATGGEDMPEVENVGWKYGLVKPRGAIHPDGWAYRFPNTNTTILYYWSASLCGIEPFNVTDPATKSAMNLDQPPAFLRKYPQEESSDPVIGDAVKGTKVKLLDITAISELRDEGHISHYSLKASEGKRNSYSQVKSETKQDANAMHYMGYNASSAENTEAAT
ncbi:hypothetical protein H5410_029342, partial [Solanum commersonii]